MEDQEKSNKAFQEEISIVVILVRETKAELGIDKITEHNFDQVMEHCGKKLVEIVLEDVSTNPLQRLSAARILIPRIRDFTFFFLAGEAAYHIQQEKKQSNQESQTATA